MKRNFTTNLMNEARRKFYSDLIAENSSNQRNLFSAAKRLLNQGNQVSLKQKPSFGHPATIHNEN